MNWVIFILIFISLLCRPNVRKETSNNGNLRKLKENFMIALGLSLLFGMGWAIGLLASSDLPPAVRSPAEWIFTVVNAFMGVYLFVLYVLRSPEARKLWKRWLLCQCKSKGYDISSRGSTQKTWTSTLRSWGGTLKRSTLKKTGKKTSTLSRSADSATANIYSFSNPPGGMVDINSSYAEPSSVMEKSTAGVASPSLQPLAIELVRRLDPDGQSNNEEAPKVVSPCGPPVKLSTECIVETMFIQDSSSLLSFNAPSAQFNSSLSGTDADCYILANKETEESEIIPQ